MRNSVRVISIAAICLSLLSLLIATPRAYIKAQAFQSSWASNITVTRCWSGDGPYVPAADVGTKCPPRLTGGSTDTVTTTSYNITVTTDKSSGTIYAYTSTSATPPSRKVLIAGTGAVHHGTITVSATGAQTRAVTGGTADTQYYTHTVHISTAGRPSNRVTISQRTSASSPPSTTPVAGYFWGTGGSDLAAGTSNGARFASLTPIMSLSGVAVGTDVWGLAGSTHNITSSSEDDVTTQWGGSSGNPAYFATYYLAGGTTPTAVWDSTETELDVSLPGAATLNTMSSQTLASVNGALSDTCLINKNCDWNYPIANECGSASDAIFFVKHDYVTIRAMKVEESSCRTIHVKSASASGEGDGTLIGFRLKDSIVEQSGHQAVFMESGVKYSLVHDTIGRFLGECNKSSRHGGTVPTGTSVALSASCLTGGGSSFIVHSSHRSFSGFNNVTLFAGATEMLHCLRSSHVLMRYNRGGNVVRAGVYRDTCGDSVVEQNVVWGPNGNLGFGPGTFSASSIWGGTPDNNAEGSQYDSAMSPTNNLIRSNLFIGLSYCGALNLSATAAAGLEHASGKFYHNTCVAMRTRSVNAGNNITAALNDGYDMKNNIFADPTTLDAEKCSSDTTGNYNLWSKAPAAACQGANDIASSAATAALLTLPVGTSSSPNTTNIATWRAKDYLNPPSIEDARPTAATHTGTRLNNIQCISDADVTEWNNILTDIDDPVAVVSSTWKMCAPEHLDGEATANTPVLGALSN